MGAASHSMGFDIDSDALAQTRENLEQFGLQDHVDLVQIDLSQALSRIKEDCMIKNACQPLIPKLFDCDTVLMNPPFGTKLKGIDMQFLEFASIIARGAIYSLHKTSTREFIVKKATALGLDTTVIAELKVSE